MRLRLLCACSTNRVLWERSHLGATVCLGRATSAIKRPHTLKVHEGFDDGGLMPEGMV